MHSLIKPRNFIKKRLILHSLDKATSELLPKGQDDIALYLEISDMIRSKTVPAKEAVRVLKKRITHKNPNVQLMALNVGVQVLTNI